MVYYSLFRELINVVITMLLLLIPLFLLPFISLPLNISVEYKRKGEDDYFQLDLYLLFKYPRLSLRLPAVRSKITGMVTKVDRTLTTVWPGEGESKLTEGANVIRIQLTELAKLLKMYGNLEIINAGFKALNVRCLEFSWETEYGCANPALTGIGGGFIWTLKGNILSFLDQYIYFLHEPQISVLPDFNRKKFATFFKGIFSTTVGNIIFTGLTIIYYLAKGGFRQWGNIQLKN